MALTDKKVSHIPYRESKLTRILSESLGGNSKTCLIITCSPHPFNEAETLSTLRFGARARNIKNDPKVNREYSIPELKKMLAVCESKVVYLEGKVRALIAQIIELGGQPPSDLELEKIKNNLVMLENEETQESSLKTEEKKHSESEDDIAIDIGEGNQISST